MTSALKAFSVKSDRIHKRLREILPPESLLSEREDLQPYESDGLTAFHRLPMLVAIPETEEQVRQILRACHEENVPVVARGSGTGLSGGATPHDEGVLLSLARFKKILNIDPLARTARVQPGVRNLAISEAVAPHGLYYAPDPSSQIACSIGGNVAENSGGVHCLKYGLTVHNILALRVVTIEGEILEIGSEALDSPGYDFLALMTGSEGMLGVITEVTVKLLPKPERAQVIMAGFDDVAKAGAAVTASMAAVMAAMTSTVTTSAVTIRAAMTIEDTISVRRNSELTICLPTTAIATPFRPCPASRYPGLRLSWV